MRLLFAFLMIGFSTIISAQNTAAIKEDTIYTKVEVMPEYPGGNDSLFKFILKNINYPSIPETDSEIRSRLVLSIVINKDGSVSDIKVKRSISKNFDDEAIRVVKLLSKFKPGEHNGVPVRVEFVVPMMFCPLRSSK